ncbi:P-loop NTPase fold protein [Pseudonocardia sp. RS010]|uniref:KAP family P-loop NTPase fold protein n=1 Tax=Pseudonocardia sp. RS010 TaxID=3385979 RepID=UPI00399F544D
MATELGISDDAYHDELYSGRTRTDVTIPAGKLVKILGLFFGLTAAVSVLLVGVVALVALFLSGPYGEDFSGLARSAVTAGLVPAALLSALIALTNKTLQVDRSTGKPDSDEQFEAIFKRLVDKSKAKRLVVFVDELDRCAADEVVATLDAIRTFLGVDRCVFVIAADQRVLEESLTRAARQETPVDEVNPYYSTGSAYLDKVFQYQISLPPLMSQRITEFAADLVRARAGLWSEINSAYVVSVLIPTHVASPRRVKHLLNTFALTYRLAQDRHRRGLLVENPISSAASVAKLVCLRVEFPLFARDLEIDARLPEMVLRFHAAKNADPDESWPEPAVERAKASGITGVAPTTMLTDDEDEPSATSSEPAAQSNRQLIDYLRRTTTIPGPSRDLVFLHSTGTAFGLEGQTALAVEAAAENADIDAVVERLDRADRTTREGIVRLLDHLIRTSVGVGATNAARALLGAFRHDDTLPVTDIADSTSAMIAILAEAEPGIIDADSITPAWSLAAAGSEAGALALRQVVLDKADSDPDLDASFILPAPEPALAGDPSTLARLVTRELVRENGAESILLLQELDDLTSSRVMAVASDALADSLADAIDAHEETRKTVAAPAPTAGKPRAAQATTVEEAFDPEQIMQTLARYAGGRANSGSPLSQQIVGTLLRADRRSARNAVDSILNGLPPTDEKASVEAFLQATSKRSLDQWPRWLGAINPDAVDAGHRRAVVTLLSSLWRNTRDQNSRLSTIEAAVRSCAGLVDRLPSGSRPDLTADAVDVVEKPVTDEASALERSRLLRNFEPLVDAKIVNMVAVYNAALPTLLQTFASEIDSAITVDSGLGRYLSRDAVDIVRTASSNDENAYQLVKDIPNRVAVCTWLPEPFRTELRLRLAQAADLPLSADETLPDADDMVELLQDHGSAGAVAVDTWLSLVRPDSSTVTVVLSALREARALDETTVATITDLRRGWTKGARLDFLRAHIVDPNAGPLSPDEVECLGLRDASPSEITELIIERFVGCRNNTQRKAVVSLIGAAGIADGPARRRLIETVVIPLLTPSVGEPQIGMTEIGLDA